MNLKDKNSKRDSKLEFAGILIVIVFIAASILVYMIKFYGMPLSGKTSDWGTFGDYIGGILNGGLAPLTLFLIWLTFKSQRKELKSQQELLVKQTAVMQQQTFEQTFFNWLGSFTSTVASFKQTDKPIFEDYYYEIRRLIAAENLPFIGNEVDQKKYDEYCENLARTRFVAVLTTNSTQMNYLLNTITNIYSWIADNQSFPISHKEKVFYLDILKAHLTQCEVLLLALGAIVFQNKRLIELFENHSLFHTVEHHLVSAPIDICLHFHFSKKALDAHAEDTEDSPW